MIIGVHPQRTGIGPTEFGRPSGLGMIIGVHPQRTGIGPTEFGGLGFARFNARDMLSPIMGGKVIDTKGNGLTPPGGDGSALPGSDGLTPPSVDPGTGPAPGSGFSIAAMPLWQKGAVAAAIGLAAFWYLRR